MDKRLILSVLLVMLSWEFMATSAQTTTEAPSNVTTATPAPTNNATTATPAPTNNATTATPAPTNNATTATLAPTNSATTATLAPTNSATTATPAPASSATTATPAPTNNATTASPAPTSSATTATPAPTSSATTAAPAPASSATTATPAPTNNATTASPAPTSSATTATPAPTSSATTAASLNIPSLAATLSRQDCGSLKLCAAEPSNCDPSTGDNCSFLSAKQQSGQTYNFELSGQTDGYVAAGLSTTTAEDGSYRAYICANNNGAVRFYTGTINNRQLVLSLLDSSNERGTVSNGKIQCTFTAVLPDTSTRAAGYAVSVLTGSFNPAFEEFGTPSFKILTPLLNLLDPTSLITNLLTSSAYPLMHTQSFLPVMLVSMCLLAFTAA